MRENTRCEVEEPMSTPTVSRQISSSSASERPALEKKMRPPRASSVIRPLAPSRQILPWTTRLLHLAPRAGREPAPDLIRGRIPSAAKRSDGIRVRGRLRESEPVGKPPHPTCCAPLALRLQVDLSPHAGRGGASGSRVATYSAVIPAERPRIKSG